MLNPLRNIQPHVFFVSAGLVLVFLFFTVVWPEQAARDFTRIHDFVVGSLGWFYILTASFILGFAIYLFFSRFGDIRLGPDDSRPEFTRPAWFAMLFSAGMGIGLVFWGVAEPLFHYIQPPIGEGSTVGAMDESMRFTFFHWGLHPWAIYVIVGLSLGYFHYRHNLPLAPRSIFYPLLGRKIHGPIGHAIDIIAVFATLFGLATSLGLGAMQVNIGLERIFGLNVSANMQILIIAVITLVATISVVLGVSRGIRRLSNFNMTLATALLLFLLITGPTILLVNQFLSNIGTYASTIVETSFWTGGIIETGWQAAWTLFYWGWWISWAPFVGLFIARISKGRTIREFIGGVLVVPTLYAFLWFTVFGGSALLLEHFEGAGLWAATQEAPELALYALLDQYPLAVLTATAATLLVVTFFVTSSDSGSLVLGMITTAGEPRPPRPQRVFWALVEGAIAAVLLLAGGLFALQTASIIMGLPMAALLLFMCWSLLRALRVDKADGSVLGIPYSTPEATPAAPVATDTPQQPVPVASEPEPPEKAP